MSTAKCKRSGRKHTPIVSEKQRGLFGAELRRRRGGKKSRMKGITTEELERHLGEAGGKDLPKKSRKALEKRVSSKLRKVFK